MSDGPTWGDQRGTSSGTETGAGTRHGDGTGAAGGLDGIGADDEFDRAVESYCEVLEAAAEGDLTRRMDPELGGRRLSKLARTYNEAMDDLQSQLQDVWTFSGQVGETGRSVATGAATASAASDRVDRNVHRISERTDEQSEALETISREMDDISATIEEIASSATEVAETANDAAERGQRGRESAERAIDEMERVQAASEEIVSHIETLESDMADVADIVEFITDIVEQTNMLAINANIEAARAGEDGGGFAVVAQEVKNLAEETKDAAEEIEAVVETAQSQTETAVEDIQATSESISAGARTVEEALEGLTATVEAIEETSDAVEEISGAVDDQADANERVSARIDEVVELGERVDEEARVAAGAVGRQSSTIDSISDEADALYDAVGSLESSLTDFAINEWGHRINRHCREAGIDWRQFEGTTLELALAEGPFPTTTEPLLPFFEELTGISVEYTVQMEDELFENLERDLGRGRGRFDAFQLGLWPAAGYHADGWVHDLSALLEDASLTDRRWYHLEDYPDSIISAFTHRGDMVGLPFGIETAGCVAYDTPTFEKLGLEEPTDFDSLRHAAKTIHESDAVDRHGFAARAASDALSTHQWVTMFKSFGADWIDYRTREAALNSGAGVASLDLYAELLAEYGPPDLESMNWFAANEAFSEGEVAILYHTPAAAGVFSDDQYARTEWLPPLEGPDGDRLSSISSWGLGISTHSDNPEAAWLFLQWATCRPMNLLLSTDQWKGQASYGHARGNWLFDQPELRKRGQADSWLRAHEEGVGLVPSDPPPVPLHTPGNMDIMSAAADAMHAAIVGRRSPEDALDTAASTITDYARQIPDAYLR